MIPRRTDRAGRRRRLAMIVRRCRTLTAVRVVEYLGRLEDRHDKVTPARVDIARAVGRCERSVTRAVAELEAAGAVKVYRDRPHPRRDGTWTRDRTNLYRLAWPPSEKRPGRADVTRVSHLSASRTVGPNGGARSAAPSPSDPVPIPLFEPDPPDPPDDPVVPPPWIRDGIDKLEWIRRQRAESV